MSLRSSRIGNLLGFHQVRPDLIYWKLFGQKIFYSAFLRYSPMDITGLILSPGHGYLMEIIHSRDIAINLWLQC